MSAGWLVVAYVAGLATLPAVLLVMSLPAYFGARGWTTHVDACRHGGPNTSTGGRGRAPGGWSVPAVSRRALSWRCDVLMSAEHRTPAELPCGGLWVRSWVAKLVPHRWLWPREAALVRRRERNAAEHERVADVAERLGGPAQGVASLRRLARETREGRHDPPDERNEHEKGRGR